MSENLVSGLAAQIELVSNKEQRWNRYIDELDALSRVAMNMRLQIVRAELQAAREAMRSGDIVPMMQAYQSLKDYSDDD